MGEEAVKAYDFKELAVGLKAKGLDIAEDAAKSVAEAVLEWLEKSAKASSNPYDDMALVVLPKVKEFVLAQVDKIDGQKG